METMPEMNNSEKEKNVEPEMDNNCNESPSWIRTMKSRSHNDLSKHFKRPTYNNQTVYNQNQPQATHHHHYHQYHQQQPQRHYNHQYNTSNPNDNNMAPMNRSASGNNATNFYENNNR